MRTSAQKAGLVLDLIRGRDVNHALATLRFARKGVAQRHREGPAIRDRERAAARTASAATSIGCSVDACYANQGPSQKRIRPAPMGRAFRVVKRTAHLTVRSDRAAVAFGERASVSEAPRAAKPRPRAAARDEEGRARARGAPAA